MIEESKKVAVFIDAENIPHEYAERILSEASNYGDVIIKRIYADWSKMPQLKQWKEKSLSLALRGDQQFAAVNGKNTSDIALVVDVLTNFYEKRIDVFCLASSDSDYTRLVQELKERQKTVVGFGMKQTTPAFVKSFSEFIYLDKDNVKESKQAEKEECLPSEQLTALKDIIENLIDTKGKALYASIGMEMKNKFSDFIPKNYGYRTLGDLIKKSLAQIGRYETKSEGPGAYLISKK